MIRLRTLGSVELKSQGGEDLRAVLAQPKRLALLVYLAAARPFRVHRRDDLLALFWPDLDDTRARDALNQALRFLRQALSPDAFIRRGGEDVGVDPDRIWCDAAAFQEALEAGRPAQALELYRGDFLQGFFIEDGGGFEDWLERERAGHRESAARGARQLAETHASEGALTLAIDWGRRALEFAPDDERALRRLLRWHDRAGDRAGAFRVFEAFARRFEREFGGAPSEETRELIERLRAGQPLTEQRSPALPVPSPRPFGKDPNAEVGDRYRIVRKLGAGGMATVYLAQDVKHDREVALKVLRPEISEGLARERFIREIRIAGRLQHPNIVPLFDSGVADERLYYVMAHIEGETLRDRLTREGRFEITLVQHVLREIAGALAYAHERGVIHRDIKPENILLIDQRAVLTDFGIARAAHAARTPAGDFDQTLTQPGTSLGTPAYMSPEQAAGNPEVDQRADLYALGVLGYEMLTGRAPFVGSSAQQILMAQMLEQPVPVAELRPETPAGLGALVMHCLEKNPAARPHSAQEFLGGLESGGPAVPTIRRRRWLGARRWVGVGVGLLLVGLLGVLLPIAFRSSGQRAPATVVPAGDISNPDTSRYAILPFERDPAAPAGLPVEQFMQDAFARWDGISVVDRFQVSDAMSRQDSARFTTADAGRVAAEIGAGRYVRGDVTPVGDSLRIHAGLYDLTRQNRVIAEGTVRVPRSLIEADSAFASLADHLLFQESRPPARGETAGGTRSLPARLAYDRGYGAIQDWELARADSEFVTASRLDARYTEAFLWLALVRSWRGLQSSEWVAAADRVATDRARLSRRDRVLSDALVDLAAGNVPSACNRLLNLTGELPYDFAAWYGAGTCLSRDTLVVRDARSPSGWAFRSSHAAALDAFARAFKLLPSIHRSLRDRAFEPVRSLFKTSARYLRSGTSAGPDGQKFVALPTWAGDSLAFVPRPAGDFLQPEAGGVPANVSLAVSKQREAFHRIASAWAVDNSESPHAMEALALSLELLANRSALDTLRKARLLATAAEDRLRLASAEVWLRLKLSVPSDRPGIEAAKRLADSLLHSAPSAGASAAGPLIGLAVLTGRAGLAEALARRVNPEAFLGVPPRISRSAAPLLALSSLGGPPDRLRELHRELERDIEGLLQPQDREAAYLQWLIRCATLSFDTPSPLWLRRIAPRGDYLLDAQHRAMDGDTSGVRAMLRALSRTRLPPEDLGLDAVYPEAKLFVSLSDIPGAIGWLDPVLAALPLAAPRVSNDPSPFGSLVRASALRADLAMHMGDATTARRWAEVVTILWSDADSFLKPIVDRLRRSSRPGG